MANHHFISYSSVDANDFAIKLRDELEAGPPPIHVWLDKRDLKGVKDWDEQIDEAIRTCESLIFVMTLDSVKPQSVCKNEWSRALSYKKPVIPILFHSNVKMPFRLGSRQYIDFTRDFVAGLAQLHKLLRWMESTEGMLQTLKDRLEDAERDLSRAPDDKQARIKDEITQLNIQIADLQQIVENPEKAQKHLEESIKVGIEKERTPEKPVSTAPCAKFINPPPAVPTYFQDRSFETKLIGDFLKNDSQRLMTVVGRAGIGKTAMVCRFLRSLEKGKLPDDGGELSVDGIVYLSERGIRKVNFPNIYTDLCRLLPPDIAGGLDQVYRDPRMSTEAKMQYLLTAFPQGRVILLLDNFETLMDPETRNISNTEMNEALHALLDYPSHAIKVILTTRIAPYDLAFVHPGLQFSHHMDKGLESPYAENILREMDLDEKLGLKSAPESLLNEARIRTLGNPRALIALFTILSADHETTLAEILKDTKKLLPEKVMDVLIGEAFSRIDANAQRVMQAIAVYSRPVTSSAIDYMLQPYIQGQDSASVLKRLVNMHLVQKDENHYYMHPVDHDYALSHVPEGTTADRMVTENPPFSLFALLHRGADYFKLIRSPSEKWKSIDDLSPHLAEFELRYAGEDYDTAASVLLEIFDYLLLYGHFHFVIKLHERLEGKLKDPWLKSNNAGNLGSAYHSIGEGRKAIKYGEKALVISLKIEDRKGEGIWLGNLGNAYRDLGHVDKAIKYYQKAFVIAREIGNQLLEGNWLGNLGMAYRDLGHVDKAIEYYQKAFVIAREIRDRKREGIWLGYMGIAYSDLGQIEKAIEYCDKALAIAREIRDRKREGDHLGNLGISYSNLGQVDKAIEYCDKALAIAREIRDRNGEGVRLGSLGSVYSKLGEVEKAIEYYEQALTIFQEIGDRKNEGVLLGNLGNSYYSLGEVEKAIKYYDKALALAQETGNRINEGIWLGDLGNAYYSLGEVEKAINYYEQALAIAQEIGNKSGEGAWLNNLGYAFQTEKKYREALACYLLTRKIRIEIKDPNLKTTESNISNLKEELGENEFEKLVNEVESASEEIMRKILE